MGIFSFFIIVLPLIIILVVLGVGVTLVRSLLRMFGFGGNFRNGYGQQATRGEHTRQTQSQVQSDSPSKSKKVIEEDEGEYVEFEEVK